MTLHPVIPVKVEIAFDPPNADWFTLTWVDVTSRLRASGVTMTRGRSDERAARMVPGTASLQLDNADGALTPGNSASPYYPNVLPWRWLRVSLDIPGLDPSFIGFIKSWRQTWDGAVRPVVQLQAVDRMVLLGRRQLRSVLSEEILDDDPLAYWPLGEPDGVRSVTDAVAGATLDVASGSGESTLTFATATGPPCDEQASPQWARVSDGETPPYLTGNINLTLGSAWTVEAFVNYRRGTGSGVVRAVELQSPQQTWQLQIAGDGTPSAAVTNSLGGALAGSSTNVGDGRTHHLAMTYGSGTLRLYVDGALAGTDSLGTVVADDVQTVRVGLSAGGGLVTGKDDQWSVSHAAVYDRAVSPTHVAAHYTAGMTGFAGEPVATRLARWCGWIGAGFTSVDLPDGPALGHIDTLGKTVLEVAETALAADPGGLVFGPAFSDLALGYRAGSNRYSDAVTVTLDASTRAVDADLDVMIDDSMLAATVTVSGGGVQRSVRHAAVAAAYGESELVIETSVDADYAQALAEWTAATAATPTPRLPVVTTDLTEAGLNTALWSASRYPLLWSRVRLTNLPAGAPASSIDAFVEGITERIGLHEWRVTVNLSPAEPWTKVWVIEGPGDSGKIEAGYVVAL